MGGSPKPKKETNAERNARLLAAKRSGKDAASLALDQQMLKKARMRSSVFGGPESGYSLGGSSSTLGVMG